MHSLYINRPYVYALCDYLYQQTIYNSSVDCYSLNPKNYIRIYNVDIYNVYIYVIQTYVMMG